ncbi:MAG: hypothetical protein HKN47_09480 [Pirellulaceae bacterium]|nr:hypothetical protein [Pirellulaceae bacterium]
MVRIDCRKVIAATMLLVGLLAGLFVHHVHAQGFMGRGVVKQDWVAMWAFNGRSEAEVKTQLRSDYQMRLKMIDRLCGLDQPQVSKLETAASADITRLFRKVTEVRREVDALDLDGNNNQDVNQIWQIVSPISTRLQQGVFEEKSLFQKVMRSTLSKQQQDRYKEELAENRRRRWKAITRVNVAEIERSMPLLNDQRRKLLEILDEQDLPTKITKQMDGYVGYLKLIKAKKQNAGLEIFLDKQQMVVIQQYCDRYRGWEGMLR